jgi:undecaprenyl-diphosphatase
VQLRFDRWLGGEIVGRPDWLVGAADALGSSTRDIASGAVVAVGVALLWHRHRLWAQWLLWSAVVGFALQNVLKQLIDRARPDWPDAALHLTTPSFPSGHAMSGIDMWCVLGLAMVLAPVAGRFPKAVGALVLAVGVLMGPSRLVVGVHWPTDVLAGWLLGAAVACLAGALVLRRARSSAPSP